MPYSPEQIHELDVLIRYKLDSTYQGIKVKDSAFPWANIKAKRNLLDEFEQSGFINGNGDGKYKGPVQKNLSEYFNV